MPDIGPPIASGRTAEIFAWGDGKVLKLTRPGFNPVLAEQEYANLLTAWRLGAPAPQPFELVEVEGRSGVVLEHIQGSSLIEAMQKRPWRLVGYARLLARQQAALHTLRVPGFPSLIERAQRNISASNLLASELKERLLARLTTLPEDDHLCHGDFHPLNILIADRGPVVIDWEGCMHAAPSADVAITRLWFRAVPLLVPAGRQGWLVRRWARDAERFYLAEYNRVASAPALHQPAWIAIVTAMRLSDEVGPFLSRVLPLIEQGLAEPGLG
jgi:uncharacterized protein (TIGR02172 family)